MINPVPKPKNYCRCGCGTEIKATRKYVSGHNLKRRPKDAIVKNGRLYKKVKCSECGTDFERRADQINRYGKKNFCSGKCVGLNQSKERLGKILPNARKGVYFDCEICKKEFYRQPSYIKKAMDKGTEIRFCSKKCYTKWQKRSGYIPKGFISSTNNTGKNNGRYKHGKRIGGHVNKKELREKVIERDGGNWCLLCGEPGPGLHLHRIVYGSQGGKYELDNCVQLCAADHDKVHSNKKKWMPYLLDHIKKKKENQYD